MTHFELFSSVLGILEVAEACGGLEDVGVFPNRHLARRLDGVAGVNSCGYEVMSVLRRLRLGVRE
jgi:hypothetical protein